MIFVGDVAIANGDNFKFLGFDNICAQPWCINLEGSILTDVDLEPSWGVYNNKFWRDNFIEFNLGPVFIGNNHIHDVENGIQTSCDRLESDGLKWFGAGSNDVSAAQVVESSDDNLNYRLIGFGWPVIGCLPASKSSPGVNELISKNVLTQVRAAIDYCDDQRIVVVLHGNYEFEKYPQPAHRQLSKRLIDEGVHAVIWHHPHIVGPIERYKDRLIAYSLGNWSFSYGQFMEGRLKFPESSFQQIALEVGENSGKVHHAIFEPPSVVRYMSSEDAFSNTFSLKPDFEGFDEEMYMDWFKVNRLKKRGLPIYRSYQSSILNNCKDAWVKFRQRIIKSAVNLNLKKMYRS